MQSVEHQSILAKTAFAVHKSLLIWRKKSLLKSVQQASFLYFSIKQLRLAPQSSHSWLQKAFHIICDGLVLAAGEEQLLEVLARHGAADQLLVDVPEAVHQGTQGFGADLVQNPLVAHLRLHPLRGIALAVTKAEQLFEYFGFTKENIAEKAKASMAKVAQE